MMIHQLLDLDPGHDALRHGDLVAADGEAHDLDLAAEGGQRVRAGDLERILREPRGLRFAGVSMTKREHNSECTNSRVANETLYPGQQPC